EKRGGADALTEEKLARLDQVIDGAKARLDDALLRDRRPPLGLAAGAGESPDDIEHKQAFEHYVRAGEYSGLRAFERKSLNSGSGPGGGQFGPETIERDILARLAALSPVRGLATVRRISQGVYKRAYAAGPAACGWVGEMSERPQTQSPTVAEMSFPAMELYAMPAATQTILDDSVVDIHRWLADEIEQSFAEQESAALVHGDGDNRPRGFLSYGATPHDQPADGKLGYVATGAAGRFPETDPADRLIDLIYALKSPLRRNASFVLNRRTQAVLRKFKSSSGEYLWNPPAAIGQPASLMGFPLVEVEDMPDIAADSFAIAFGDFRRGYLVVDRKGVSVLRDLFTAKPYVLFYTTKRVGGGVQDFDAIKLLRFAAE